MTLSCFFSAITNVLFVFLVLFPFHVLCQSPKQYSYYGVFDGHAGVDAATFAASHLHHNLVSSLAFKDGDVEDALRTAFRVTDSEYLERSALTKVKAGCTAVVCLRETDPVTSTCKLFFAWAGDSQAILIRDGSPLDLTPPHKPDDPKEQERIEAAGGTVQFQDIWRVDGSLGVSRAIGDPDYKPYVTADPEIVSVVLQNNDDFLVLACDGLWDQISPEEATSIVYEHLAEQIASLDDADGKESSVDEVASKVSSALMESAKKEGSQDNITVLVVFLKDIKSIVGTSSCVTSASPTKVISPVKSNPHVSMSPVEDNGVETSEAIEEVDKAWSFLDESQFIVQSNGKSSVGIRDSAEGLNGNSSLDDVRVNETVSAIDPSFYSCVAESPDQLHRQDEEDEEHQDDSLDSQDPDRTTTTSTITPFNKSLTQSFLSQPSILHSTPSKQAEDMMVPEDETNFFSFSHSQIERDERRESEVHGHDSVIESENGNEVKNGNNNGNNNHLTCGHKEVEEEAPSPTDFVILSKDEGQPEIESLAAKDCSVKKSGNGCVQSRSKDDGEEYLPTSHPPSPLSLNDIRNDHMNGSRNSAILSAGEDIVTQSSTAIDTGNTDNGNNLVSDEFNGNISVPENVQVIHKPDNGDHEDEDVVLRGDHDISSVEEPVVTTVSSPSGIFVSDPHVRSQEVESIPLHTQDVIVEEKLNQKEKEEQMEISPPLVNPEETAHKESEAMTSSSSEVVLSPHLLLSNLSQESSVEEQPQTFHVGHQDKESPAATPTVSPQFEQKEYEADILNMSSVNDRVSTPSSPVSQLVSQEKRMSTEQHDKLSEGHAFQAEDEEQDLLEYPKQGMQSEQNVTTGSANDEVQEHEEAFRDLDVLQEDAHIQEEAKLITDDKVRSIYTVSCHD